MHGEGQRVLGEILVRRGVIGADVAERLYEKQEQNGSAGLLEILVQDNVATALDVSRALAAECGLAFVEKINDADIPNDGAI